MLGLRFCVRAFSSCGERGPLFIAVHWPLTVAASLVVEHRLQTCRLSRCGSRAQLLRGMWDLPGPGLEPVSPALAGRFSTTAPPGKPRWCFVWTLLPFLSRTPVWMRLISLTSVAGGSGKVWRAHWGFQVSPSCRDGLVLKMLLAAGVAPTDRLLHPLGEPSCSVPTCRL